MNAVYEYSFTDISNFINNVYYF